MLVIADDVVADDDVVVDVAVVVAVVVAAVVVVAVVDDVVDVVEVAKNITVNLNYKFLSHFPLFVYHIILATPLNYHFPVNIFLTCQECSLLIRTLIS